MRRPVRSLGLTKRNNIWPCGEVDVREAGNQATDSEGDDLRNRSALLLGAAALRGGLQAGEESPRTALPLITFVTFKWLKIGYRSRFEAHHVNTMKRMINRGYPDPHRFVCITDDPMGLDPEIEVIPLWRDLADIPNPSWPNGPSCYRRLRVFSDWFAETIGVSYGDRIACLDLDAVYRGDLRPTFNRHESFLIWQTGNPRIPFCASMFMFHAGKFEYIWSQFDANRSPRLSLSSGMKGSDQAWLAYCLGKNIPGWGIREGVYSYRDHILARYGGKLPANAVAVMFHGKPDPWEQVAMKRSPWIAEHYR